MAQSADPSAIQYTSRSTTPRCRPGQEHRESSALPASKPGIQKVSLAPHLRCQTERQKKPKDAISQGILNQRVVRYNRQIRSRPATRPVNS